MKKKIVILLYFSAVLMSYTNIKAQNQNPLIKVDTNRASRVLEAPLSPSSPPPDNEYYLGPEEHMPRFPGCETKDFNKQELENCAKEKLLKYVYESLVYPEEAKKQKMEEVVIIQFTIDQSGIMENLKLVRDPGCQFGEQAMKVFIKMQSEIIWIPAKLIDRPIKVQYTIPVKFKL